MSLSNLASVVLPLDEHPETPTTTAFWALMTVDTRNKSKEKEIRRSTTLKEDENDGLALYQPDPYQMVVLVHR